MSAHEADKQYAVSVLDGHDKAVLVPLDVEYDPVVGQKTGVAVNSLDVCRRMPFGALHIIMPRLQWLPCVGVPVPEFSEGFAGYDTHGE